MPRVRLSSLLLALILVWASACPPPGEELDTGMPDTPSGVTSFCPETITLGDCDTGVVAAPEPDVCLQNDVAGCILESEGSEQTVVCLESTLSGRIGATEMSALVRCAQVAKTPLGCAPDCKAPNNNKILLGGKGYATKADCEKDRDAAFSAAANLQNAACKQKFFCSDPNCPNLRLFEPQLTGGLCACTKDPAGPNPAKPWRFGCDLTGKFQCCCQRDI